MLRVCDPYLHSEVMLVSERGRQFRVLGGGVRAGHGAVLRTIRALYRTVAVTTRDVTLHCYDI